VDLALAWRDTSPLYVLGGDSPVSEAFFTASLLFCVGRWPSWARSRTG
jgi:hypothetical protein